MSEGEELLGLDASESADAEPREMLSGSDWMALGCGFEILVWLMLTPLFYFGLSGSWVPLVIAIISTLLYFGLRWKNATPTPKASGSDG